MAVTLLLPLELLPLEPDVFVRRRVWVGGDQGEGRLLDLGSHAANEPILPDRDKYHLVGEDLLNLVQHLLALLAIALPGLALEEILDLGHDTVGVAAFLRGERLHTSGRVATGAQHAHHDAA